MRDLLLAGTIVPVLIAPTGGAAFAAPRDSRWMLAQAEPAGEAEKKPPPGKGAPPAKPAPAAPPHAEAPKPPAPALAPPAPAHQAPPPAAKPPEPAPKAAPPAAPPVQHQAAPPPPAAPKPAAAPPPAAPKPPAAAVPAVAPAPTAVAPAAPAAPVAPKPPAPAAVPHQPIAPSTPEVQPKPAPQGATKPPAAAPRAAVPAPQAQPPAPAAVVAPVPPAGSLSRPAASQAAPAAPVGAAPRPATPGQPAQGGAAGAQPAGVRSVAPAAVAPAQRVQPATIVPNAAPGQPAAPAPAAGTRQPPPPAAAPGQPPQPATATTAPPAAAPGQPAPGAPQPGTRPPGTPAAVAPGQPPQPAAAGTPPAAAPGQPPSAQAGSRNNTGAAIAGAAAGFIGGFLAGQGVERLDDVRSRRQEYSQDGMDVIQEPGRTIVREDNRFFIAHDENQRFRDLGYDLRTERRGDTDLTIYDRPGGERILTYTDPNGRLVRRVRQFPDGREVILIDNEYAGPRRSYDEDIVNLPPPPRIDLPPDRYVVDADTADEALVYDTLIAPPVAPLPRRYTLDQIRYSPDLRGRMRSVDLNTVNFDSGSWTVSPDQVNRLAGIAQAIGQAVKKNPGEIFLVEGYTDAVGSDVDNLSLSDRRAQSVAAILTSNFQVPPENLTTQGYGKQYLKVQTQEANVQNRRVTVRRITPLLAQKAP